MEERAAGGGRRRPSKGDDYVAEVLRRSWCRLRLSVRHAARAPTWDAILLTAASPQQADLYDWQLRRAKRMGRIAESTVTLAVPDPEGARIGSGAATLHALAMLSAHIIRLGLVPEVPPLKLPSILPPRNKALTTALEADLLRLFLFLVL